MIPTDWGTQASVQLDCLNLSVLGSGGRRYILFSVFDVAPVFGAALISTAMGPVVFHPAHYLTGAVVMDGDDAL
jgi:hypothetical protein